MWQQTYGSKNSDETLCHRMALRRCEVAEPIPRIMKHNYIPALNITEARREPRNHDSIANIQSVFHRFTGDEKRLHQESFDEPRKQKSCRDNDRDFSEQAKKTSALPLRLRFIRGLNGTFGGVRPVASARYL
jgi:hypothetical protein